MGTDTAVGAGLDAEPSAMLPGIAAMAIRRLLSASSLDRDRVLVGLHLGSAGWMEWRTAEQDARRLPVPSDSLSLVPAGISYWWRRDQPSELVLVELESSFVAGVARNTDAPTTLAGRTLLPQPDASDLWAASAREVMSAPIVDAAPNTTPQPCVQCGLSLSASARFCRRCGTRQA